MMKNELIRMYHYPSMIKSMAFCAAVFALLSVLLKFGIILIPEVMEVRICNMVACPFGIMFGPAGAWGCAIGNLIGDMGGSLTWLSFWGFWANFFSAWLPYKVWVVTGKLLQESDKKMPSVHSGAWVVRYLLCAFTSVVSCGALLSLTFDLDGDMAAANTFEMVFINNMGASLLGIILFIALGFIKYKGLYWRSQMTEEAKWTFSQENRGSLVVILVSTFVTVIFCAVYMIAGHYSLQRSDSCGKILPLAVFAVYLAVTIVFTLRCRWKEAEDEKELVISLD